ncbi:MAG: DUF177 domain-containing protein [Desulfovibrio sp.]|nr:DUF177 domain-containing protein [Desulfovibrio sp.]
MRDKHRIFLNDLPPEGKTITLDDPAIWNGPIEEFAVGCRVVEPVTATVRLIPTDGGCLVRGTLTGRVVMQCARCAEDAEMPVEGRFENFEALPSIAATVEADEEGKDEDFEPVEEDTHIVIEGGVPSLNLAEICWEEFLMALPPSPLCRPDCKGLCPGCGANLNNGPCTCRDAGTDPRMAVFRGLKVSRS